MLAEGLLPGRGGVLILGVRKDQHAVDVHDHRAVAGWTVRFEKVLRIVIDQSGRIVTAIPADKLIALGVTAAGIEAFSERTAKAAETVHASVERQNALETVANADTSSWWEWVPLIDDIWGGDLNSGESQYLEAGRESASRDKFVAEVVESAV